MHSDSIRWFFLVTLFNVTQRHTLFLWAHVLEETAGSGKSQTFNGRHALSPSREAVSVWVCIKGSNDGQRHWPLLPNSLSYCLSSLLQHHICPVAMGVLGNCPFLLLLSDSAKWYRIHKWYIYTSLVMSPECSLSPHCKPNSGWELGGCVDKVNGYYPMLCHAMPLQLSQEKSHSVCSFSSTYCSTIKELRKGLFLECKSQSPPVSILFYI